MKLNLFQAKLAAELFDAEPNKIARIQMMRDLVSWATGEIAPYGRLEEIARLGYPDTGSAVINHGRGWWRKSSTDLPVYVPPVYDEGDLNHPPTPRTPEEQAQYQADLADLRSKLRESPEPSVAKYPGKGGKTIMDPHFTDPGDRKPGRTA